MVAAGRLFRTTTTTTTHKTVPENYTSQNVIVTTMPERRVSSSARTHTAISSLARQRRTRVYNLLPSANRRPAGRLSRSAAKAINLALQGPALFHPLARRRVSGGSFRQFK